MPTTKKPRILIPENPDELMSLADHVFQSVDNHDSALNLWDNQMLRDLATNAEQAGNAAEVHQAAYVAANATKKIEREARDVDLETVRTNLRQVRDMGLGLLPAGEYARMGEIGFTVLVTEAAGEAPTGEEEDFVPIT